MKKIVAIVLAMVMVMGLATTAFAAPSDTDFDLYQADKTMNTMLALGVPYATYTDVQITENNAKTNADGSGNIAYLEIGNGNYFVKTTAPTTGSFAVTAHGKSTVLYYVDYVGTSINMFFYSAKVNYFDSWGLKCGQLDNTGWGAAQKADDYLVTAAGAIYAVDWTPSTTWADNYLLDGFVVTTKGAAMKVKDHTFVANNYSYDAKTMTNIPASALCTTCQMETTSIYKNWLVPATYKVYALSASGNEAGTYVVGLGAAAPSAPAAGTAGETVESAKTFDAGIAMYVGMSVMAAAGSAVVLKKKD